MCDRPRAAIDSTREWQQAAALLTSNDKLFVCVFMWSVRPERPSVAECPPRPEQTRQDRASHFLQPPLVKLPIFTPVALELLCLSLWATSWWHSGNQTQQVSRRRPGVRHQQGGVGEQIKCESTEKQLIKSQTLCFSLFSLVFVDLWAGGIMMTSILFMLICCCLLKSNMDGPGWTLLSRRLSMVYVTLPRPCLATGCALAQQVERLSDSPQVLFATGGSQGQRTRLYFKFRLSRGLNC